MRSTAGLSCLVLACAAPLAAAQAPEAAYKAKCSVCHDSGAGQAPRLDDRAAWRERAMRGRAALHAAAIEGKPNTTMAAKGGFPELSEAETRAIVDYMLRAAGQPDVAAQPLTAAAPPSQGDLPASSAGGAPGTDEAISTALAERLRAAFGKPDHRIETYEGVVTLRGVGIKVQTRAGVTTLAGTLHDGEIIRRAGEIAASFPGVRQVVNRLIPAASLDWD